MSIDEGNRTERVTIGLGAGRSDVRAQVQVYEVTPAGTRLVDTIEVDGKSGLTPGMAESMGVGGLAGHLLVATAVGAGVHVVSESMGTDVSPTLTARPRASPSSSRRCSRAGLDVLSGHHALRPRVSGSPE